MQLVEQGKLSLDDAELVGKLAPELKKARILDGFDENDRPVWKEKKNQITLRHLLSHTCKSSSSEACVGYFWGWVGCHVTIAHECIAGLGYTFFNPELKKVGYPRGIDEFSGRFEDLDPVLLFEPGAKFNYGVSSVLRF